MSDHQGSTGEELNRPRGWVRRLALAPIALVFGALIVVPALAQAGPSDDVLVQGADVYQLSCSSCHQPGGVGLVGQFPPLVDNPNLDDTAYVEMVIREGRSGPLTVDGAEYDGNMPPQSTLSDSDIDAVVAYIDSGFATPAVAEVAEGETSSDSGGGIPSWVKWGLLIGVIAIFVVNFKRIIGVIDRRTVPWSVAWMKSGVIVIAMILLTTIIPARALEVQAVIDMPREVQDLIAVGLWTIGLGGGLWALWWAHRERRI